MGRRKNSRQLQKSVLIYTEGKTEKSYFLALQRQYRCGRHLIIKSLAKQSISLANEVERRLKKNCDVKRSELEQVYVIFDKDDCSWEEIDKALKKLRENNVRIGFSNESFEVWLLMHFKQALSQPMLDRKNSYKQLSECLGINYKNAKGNSELGNFFVDKVNVAITNSHQATCPLTLTNKKNLPFTNLSEIVEEIFQLTG